MTATEGHDALVSAVCAEMGAVLSGSPVAPTDDFFDLGADSRLAVDLIQRLVRRFGTAALDATPDAADRLRADLVLGVFDDATAQGIAGIVGQWRDSVQEL